MGTSYVKIGAGVARAFTASSASASTRQAKKEHPRWASGTLCIGNQAGDLDSIVSALGMAYLRARSPHPPLNTLAVAPFPRAEFQLRKDAVLLFDQAGFPPTSLAFLDEVSPARGSAWDAILTDHHEPEGTLVAVLPPAAGSAVAARVREVVDHHKVIDPTKTPATGGGARLIDEGTGSACSLVAGLFAAARVRVPPDLGLLLYGAILMDTRDFDPEKRRFNGRDVAAEAFLR
jgi:exopolyphosphatase